MEYQDTLAFAFIYDYMQFSHYVCIISSAYKEQLNKKSLSASQTMVILLFTIRVLSVM